MNPTAPPDVGTAREPSGADVARRERVLIIDDEEHIRSTLAEFLAISGFGVETANDGESGLARLSRRAYDLVLCDLKMPGVDGAAVIERVQSRHPGMKVIVMTGHATVDNAVHALRAGAYDFLRKPFTFDELGRTIENCLEKKRLQARNIELTETNERLREIERIKDDLLSTVSHEFRTPLAAMNGFLALMERGGTDNLRPDQSDALDAIRANVERLDVMIRNLLTLTECHDGGYRAVLEPILAGEFLDEFFDGCDAIWESGGFRCEIEEAARSAPLALDRGRFPLVLSNLIDNAFKFARGPRLGRVVFRARRADDRVHLEVHDDGVGIAPSVGDRVFERFTQADMTSTREFPGAGLGLAVVHEVVQAHRGTVHLDEPELGGTSIRVTLPVVRP